MTATSAACARCSFPPDERACNKEGGKAPEGCPTLNHQEAVAASIAELEKPDVRRFACQASIQEGEGYGNRAKGHVPKDLRPIKPRIEETIEFAHRMGYRRLGLVFCIGLRKEARAVEKLLTAAGFEVVSALCKVGRTPKEAIGIRDEEKIRIGEFEPMCNPVAQAFIVNREKTEFNVVMGLCVGHDSLFLKYAEAPCTVLAAKDRLLGHNPLAAIYNIDSYYSALKQ
jgi:uncharacterized metal-binding protein